MTKEQALLFQYDVEHPNVQVRDMVFDSALKDWWDRACWSDRYYLLQNFGFTQQRASQYATWCWDHLPRQPRSFIIGHALDGHPMEYLGYKREIRPRW